MRTVIIMITNNRAISSTISFTLALVIITLLSAILLSSTAGMTINNQEKLDRKSATILNNELTDSIQRVDSQSGGESIVEPKVRDKSYNVTIKSTSSENLYKVIVQVGNTKSTNLVSTKNSIDNIPITTKGDSFKVTYDGSSGELVISNEI